MAVIPFPKPIEPPANTFRYPNVAQRTVVMGKTGSGKTQFGAWLLSESPFNKQPYIIMDYKRDALLGATDRIREIGLNEIPKHPGLYIVRPLPEIDDSNVENWLWKIWKRGKTGLYFDETYMLPNDGRSTALRALYTQGRSLHIPIIALTQRPAWVSRFVFSEAEYYSYFHFNDSEDIKTARRWFPSGLVEERLPKYYSVWYDQDADNAFVLSPVPDSDTILDHIDYRLGARRVTL